MTRALIYSLTGVISFYSIAALTVPQGINQSSSVPQSQNASIAPQRVAEIVPDPGLGVTNREIHAALTQTQWDSGEGELIPVGTRVHLVRCIGRECDGVVVRLDSGEEVYAGFYNFDWQ